MRIKNLRILGILLIALVILPTVFALTPSRIFNTHRNILINERMAEEIIEKPVEDSFEGAIKKALKEGNNFVMCDGEIPNGDLTYCAIGETSPTLLGIYGDFNAEVWKKENGKVKKTDMMFSGSFHPAAQNWFGFYNWNIAFGTYSGDGTWEGYNLFSVEGNYKEKTSGSFIIY